MTASVGQNGELEKAKRWWWWWGGGGGRVGEGDACEETNIILHSEAATFAKSSTGCGRDETQRPKDRPREMPEETSALGSILPRDLFHDPRSHVSAYRINTDRLSRFSRGDNVYHFESRKSDGKIE